MGAAVPAARLAALGALAALALTASGCRLEDAQQEAARKAVEQALGGDDAYEPGGVHCTGAASPWFVAQETHVFLCTVRLRGGRCDVYRVEAPRDRPVSVRLDERAADCTLPV